MTTKHKKLKNQKSNDSGSTWTALDKKVDLFLTHKDNAKAQAKFNREDKIKEQSNLACASTDLGLKENTTTEEAPMAIDLPPPPTDKQMHQALNMASIYGEFCAKTVVNPLNPPWTTEAGEQVVRMRAANKKRDAAEAKVARATKKKKAATDDNELAAIFETVEAMSKERKSDSDKKHNELISTLRAFGGSGYRAFGDSGYHRNAPTPPPFSASSSSSSSSSSASVNGLSVPTITIL
jgi:hypothetical protein